jgi:hypothetical protein
MFASSNHRRNVCLGLILERDPNLSTGAEAMLEILQAPNYVASFKLSKDVTAEDYDRIIAEVESRLKIHSRIAAYAELAEPVHFTPRALLTDLRYAFSKFSEWSRFARVAVVTEKPWLRALASASGALLPNIEVRVFASGGREAALSWCSELRPDAPQQPALRLIATTRPDTYAFAWNGRITRSDIDHVLGVLRTELESHMSVRLLGRIERMGGIELGALLRSSLFRLKLLGVRKIERYALVSGPSWLGRYVGVARKLTGIDLRHFPREREEDAWSWLEAQPVSSAESAGGQASAVASANTRAASTLNYD